MYRPSLILYAFDVDWGPLTPPLKALEEHCQNGNRAFGSARKFMVRGVFDRSYYRLILLVSPVQLYAIVLHGDGRRSVRKNTRASGTLHLVLQVVRAVRPYGTTTVGTRYRIDRMVRRASYPELVFEL